MNAGLISGLSRPAGSGRLLTYPIFDSANVLKQAVSSGELIFNAINAVGLAANAVVSNNSVFVAYINGSTSSTVATSTDGRVWVIRTLPAAGVWTIVSDGVGFIAFNEGNVGANTAATSADGITWTGNSFGGQTMSTTLQFKSAGNSGSAIVYNGGSNVMYSSNGGTSWFLRAIPEPFPTIISVNGAFLARGNSGITYRGTFAGVWTAFTMPGTTDSMLTDLDGSALLYQAGSGSANVYRTIDGTTFANLGFQLWDPASSIRSFGGVYMSGSGGNLAVATRHADWVPRSSQVGFSISRNIARAGNKFVLVSGGNAYLAMPSASDAKSGVWV